MHRRAVIAATAVALATPAAAGGPSSDGDAAAAHRDLTSIGVPVIVDGRLRNYVFVRVRLHLAPGADVAAVERKAPFFREGIVRAAHQRPFTVPDDWQAIDTARLEAAVMHVAPRLVGPGVVLRAETVSQAPRRRVGPRRP